jgi:predicted RNA-binding Zn-ribbon protein involved in translation (DUF1610 family)
MVKNTGEVKSRSKEGLPLQCKSCGFAGFFPKVKSQATHKLVRVNLYECPKCGVKVAIPIN